MNNIPSNTRNWGVPAYFAAVLFAVGLLFAITTIPSNSADLFANPGPDELMRAVQWVWEGRACSGSLQL